MEEATHLVRNGTALHRFLLTPGVAHLVHVPRSTGPPSDDLVASRTAARVARSKALAERMRSEEEERVAASKAAFAATGDKARAKREERARKRAAAARDAALAAGENPEDVEKTYAAAIAASASTNATPPPAKAKEQPAPTAENTNLFTVIPALPVDDSLLPKEATSLSSEQFPFPATVRDAALADAFDALHDRGLRMGLGPRFGGEYLVYPGDYLRYHAHFTSQVIVRDEPIKPAQLVAWGRLGTGTKKAGLLCCWDDEGRGEDKAKKGNVEFYSLEWANFG